MKQVVKGVGRRVGVVVAASVAALCTYALVVGAVQIPLYLLYGNMLGMWGSVMLFSTYTIILGIVPASVFGALMFVLIDSVHKLNLVDSMVLGAFVGGPVIWFFMPLPPYITVAPCVVAGITWRYVRKWESYSSRGSIPASRAEQDVGPIA